MSRYSRRGFLMSSTAALSAAALARPTTLLAQATGAPAPIYDLVIKGGEVIDPSQKLRARRDVAIRYAAVVFGGACAGLGGTFLAVAYTPSWVEGMTAGRGWIALALVVFATWRPWRVLAGAYLFGSVTLAQFQAQASGVALPSQMLAMLPYIATIVVLIVNGTRRQKARKNTARIMPTFTGIAGRF